MRKQDRRAIRKEFIWTWVVPAVTALVVSAIVSYLAISIWLK